MLEDSSSELKVMDGMEEMAFSAAEHQDIVMCSPEKDNDTETNFVQSGEPKPHQTGALTERGR